MKQGEVWVNDAEKEEVTMRIVVIPCKIYNLCLM
jgi:hypothetical protein